MFPSSPLTVLDFVNQTAGSLDTTAVHQIIFFINVRPAHIFQAYLWSLMLTPDPSSQLMAHTATNLEFRSNCQTPVSDTEAAEIY